MRWINPSKYMQRWYVVLCTAVHLYIVYARTHEDIPHMQLGYQPCEVFINRRIFARLL